MVERIPASGVFVLDDGAVPAWWEGTITASREALISAGEYRDLGPVKLRLDEAGHVMRLSDGGLVPLTLVRPQAGQSFHYVMEARGQDMRVRGSFEIPEGAVELDLPTALRASIPDDELPEWLRIRSAVETARDEAVAAAGEATLAVAGLDAAIQDAVDTKVPAAVDQKITEIDLPALVGDEINSLAGPAVQVEVDARVDPLVTAAAGSAAAADASATAAAGSASSAALSETSAAGSADAAGLSATAAAGSATEAGLQADRAEAAAATAETPTITATAALTSGASAGTVRLERIADSVTADISGLVKAGTVAHVANLPTDFQTAHAAGHDWLEDQDGEMWMARVTGTQIEVLGPPPAGTTLKGSMKWMKV